MKKFITSLIFAFVMIISLQSQSVSNYAYKLDNGINVRMEQCWNHVWVSQSFEALKAQDPPVSIDFRALGDVTQGSSFQLFASGKEVKVQNAKPGTYTMKMLFKLTGKPGTISFDVENVVIKPQMKTKVSVILYDYQISIQEAAGSLGGMSSLTSKIERFKGNTELNPSCGVPSFFEPGKHDATVKPADLNGKTGKIKPGTYDVLLSLGSSSRPQKIWLEKFVMKPDVAYNITTNLNAGTVEYAGINRDFKAIQMFPAGTADRLKGATNPDKNLEIVRCEGLAVSVPCPPGTYDALINIGNGTKNEWRKGVVVTTRVKTQVK